MFRILSLAGAILAAIGGVVYELLLQLRSETFRADLPPWMNLSLALGAVGLVIFLVGGVLPERSLGTIKVSRASSYFGWITILNTVAAAVFSIPVLVPRFEFPILITRWPGVYMVIGYTFFVVVGVLGTFAWSAFYRWMPDLLSTEAVYRVPFLFQIAVMEVGIYVMSIFMFLGGYVGSSLAYQGVGDTIVGTAMEFAVIPTALGIGAQIASTFVGVANALFASRMLKSRASN